MDYKVEESLDLLAVYYRRLFPYELFYKWLGYGKIFYSIFRYFYFYTGSPEMTLIITKLITYCSKTDVKKVSMSFL